MNGGAAGAGAAIAAAIANAIKASGVLIRISREDFEILLGRQKDPLVIYSEGGFLSKSYKYLFSYKGFAFYCKAKYPVSLPSESEIINAGRIWIPN